jgi:hypothetical protein
VRGDERSPPPSPSQTCEAPYQEVVMEQQKLVRDFSQLRLPRPRAEWQVARPQTDRLLRLRTSMDALVHDFNTALDETTAGSNSSDRSNTARRKTWKRRCKSTSNLAQVGQAASEDSSSSVDNFGLVSKDQGTSSLQFSDSDLEGGGGGGGPTLVRSTRNRLSRLHGL